MRRTRLSCTEMVLGGCVPDTTLGFKVFRLNGDCLSAKAFTGRLFPPEFPFRSKVHRLFSRCGLSAIPHPDRTAQGRVVFSFAHGLR